MKRGFVALCMAAIFVQLCLVPEVSAKLYTWTDRNGVTRRTYYPPPPDQVGRGDQAPQNPTYQQRTDNQVELFVTSWCPYCKQAKDFFRTRGITIKVYDIEKDPQAAARKKKLDGGGGVPFAVINGKNISGYAPEQYTNALR